MNVVRIIEFLRNLSDYEELPIYDQDFLKRFKAKFMSINLSATLDKEQLVWIKNLFVERSSKVDYTHNAGGANDIWHHLANDLINDLRIVLNNPKLVCSNLLFPELEHPIDCSDLRALYVGEDKRVIYNLNDLIKKIGKKQPFYTYNYYRDDSVTEFRTLSIIEWLRIRKKRTPLPINFFGKSYPDFIEFMMKEEIPNWHKKGQLPTSELMDLASIVDLYFSEKNKIVDSSSFKNELFRWSKCLHELPIDNVHCLYGQSMCVKKESFYFLDVLLRCLKSDLNNNSSEIVSDMIEIARWLGAVNPSLISNHIELLPLYKEMRIGKFFDVDELQKALRILPVENNEIQRTLDALFSILQEKKVIDEEVISLLMNIYQTRWQTLQGIIDDNVEAPWIRLAQCLSGAGHAPSNYYKLYIPTLKHDKDPLTQLFLTSKPLSDYVLSEDGMALYDMTHSEGQLMKKNVFINWYTLPPQLFTSVERERIARSKFKHHLKIADDLEEYISPISRKTWLALYLLVNKSLYPIGLRLTKDYSPDQEDIAEKAYVRFLDFIERLPTKEREWFYAQRILYKGINKTVKDILINVEKYQCVALCGELFAKLVMEYDVRLHFREDIEQKVNIAAMRAQSKNRTYYTGEPDGSDEKHFIQTTLVSLINFYLYSLNSSDIGTGAGIFSLKTLLQSGHYNSNFLPEIFLPAEKIDKKYRTLLDDAIYKILNIYAGKGNVFSKAANINARITDLLNELDNPLRDRLVFLMTQATSQIDETAFYAMSKRYFSHRLAVLGAQSYLAVLVRFFNGGQNLQTYKQIQEQLNFPIESYKNMQHFAKALCLRISQLNDSLCSQNLKIRMTQDLNDMALIASEAPLSQTGLQTPIYCKA